MNPLIHQPHDIKPIIELLDESPIFNHTMLAFLKWIAEYYIASYGETIKAALPAGMSPHSIVKVAIKQHLNSDELDALKKRARQKELNSISTSNINMVKSPSAFSKNI
jgi:primosomal protein N'